MTMSQGNIVEIQDLEVKFYTYAGVVEALDGVNLFVREGEILGLVGETGSGKSVTSLSIMRLVPPPGIIEGGRIILRDSKKQQDTLTMSENSIRKVRGKDIAMIFQEPRAYLNPVYSTQDQIAEVMLVHRKEELLENSIASVEKKLIEGRKAVLGKQKARLDKEKPEGEKEKAELAKRRDAVEKKLGDLTTKPPPSNNEIASYRRLLRAERFWPTERARQFQKKKAELERLKATGGKQFAELMKVEPSEYKLGIGSRIRGAVLVRAMRFPARFNRKRQFKSEVRKEVVKVLKSVEIPDPERVARMYPHELSGGMAQRVVIAMALACNPRMLIADEPTTNLDVTVQAQILNLVKILKKNYGSAILYITHDLGVVAQSCDRVAVMYAGNVVETADVFETFSNPLHPYTRALLDSIPRPGEPFKSIPGIVPSLVNPLKGCRFHDRCSYATEMCLSVKPKFIEVKPDHYVSCHLYGGS
jgi:peptide/nickel transport system ATP-binding protein